VNDVFNGMDTSDLITCHVALGQRRAVESLSTVAVLDEWSTGLTSHCSRTVDARPHALQVLTTLSAHMSCRHMIGLM
jgi:hypothetical protein